MSENEGISPGEMQILLRRTGLKLNPEQFDALVKSFKDFEASGQRMRKGVARSDEPAFAFKVPRSRRER
jgi:hypothetical protein